MTANCGMFIGDDNTMNACISGWTLRDDSNYCKTNYNQERQADEYQACCFGTGNMKSDSSEAKNGESKETGSDLIYPEEK